MFLNSRHGDILAEPLAQCQYGTRVHIKQNPINSHNLSSVFSAHLSSGSPLFVPFKASLRA